MANLEEVGYGATTLAAQSSVLSGGFAFAQAREVREFGVDGVEFPSKREKSSPRENSPRRMAARAATAAKMAEPFSGVFVPVATLISTHGEENFRRGETKEKRAFEDRHVSHYLKVRAAVSLQFFSRATV